ncbi:hypothetical protein IFM51744_05866 [Aspergillus udagawae]|nr:hypothetical protein IFM51744_05866 [Aspergillus udagawae]
MALLPHFRFVFRAFVTLLGIHVSGIVGIVGATTRTSLGDINVTFANISDRIDAVLAFRVVVVPFGTPPAALRFYEADNLHHCVQFSGVEIGAQPRR